MDELLDEKQLDEMHEFLTKNIPETIMFMQEKYTDIPPSSIPFYYMHLLASVIYVLAPSFEAAESLISQSIEGARAFHMKEKNNG